MKLTDDDLRAFRDDGYVVVRGVVDEKWLAAADAEIDELLLAAPPPPNEWQRHGYALAPERLPRCDEALRQSVALAIAEQLVSPHRLENAIDHIQIAVNYPKHRHVPGGPHIDGQVPPQFSFTLLVGIYLGDETEPGRGNLYVWPGSHNDHARLFAERGHGVLLENGGHATLLDPPMPVGAGVPVLAERGDIVLSHFLTGHNSSGNEADQMRRIIYFRLACEGHTTRAKQTFLEPLTEYEPLRGLRR
jgi:ectoine hydroxylase-related dioxygenase (phytanoyl-CoA dioxygenase family)